MSLATTVLSVCIVGHGKGDGTVARITCFILFSMPIFVEPPELRSGSVDKRYLISEISRRRNIIEDQKHKNQKTFSKLTLRSQIASKHACEMSSSTLGVIRDEGLTLTLTDDW